MSKMIFEKCKMAKEKPCTILENCKMV
jgi:hypothetical protein